MLSPNAQSKLEPSAEALGTFINAIFRNAAHGVISMRTFVDGSRNEWVRISGAPATDLGFALEVAEDDARRAANDPRPLVFSPILATFLEKKPAGDNDIVEGLTLSVELDRNPAAGLETLQKILGKATVVVASGGEWCNPETGEFEEKLHAHWRLKVPTGSTAEHKKLKEARALATDLIGGDSSGKPICHPFRWPGSWHRKKEPKLCRIKEVHPTIEIDLKVALAILQKAAPAKPQSAGKANGAATDWNSSPEWEPLIKGILTGENYHDGSNRLEMKLLHTGMNDGACVNFVRALFDAGTGPRDERWQSRYDDIPRAVDGARIKIGIDADSVEHVPHSEALTWLDMSAWDHEPIPERQWAIRDRVPLRQVGLFSGEGGTGKSIIEMMKDVAHVTAKDWLGSLPEPGPAFYLGAEDDKDEIHIRLATIANHYHTTFKELIDGGLHVLCLLGQDATLCATTRSGKVETTALYKQIYEAAGDIKPKNISVDTLSRAFAGSEIDRAQVYAFAMHMQAIAMVADGAVTVLSHLSLAGMASGSGISGSTAWHGAFRFRQYLTSTKAESGEQPDNDLRQIEFKKNQYGPLGESIVLRYQSGLFLPEKGMSSLDKIARDSDAEHMFVDLLKRFDESGRNVSHKPTANNFAPTAFAKEADAVAAKLRKKDFEDAMRRLFGAGKIKAETYGRSDRGVCRIVLK